MSFLIRIKYGLCEVKVGTFNTDFQPLPVTVEVLNYYTTKMDINILVTYSSIVKSSTTDFFIKDIRDV